MQDLNSDLLSAIDVVFPGLLRHQSNIFVFTNFRSGSTALAELFDRIFIIPNLPEMLGHEKYKTCGIDMAINNEPFLTSIMPSFIRDYQKSFLTDLTSYKIKLTRNDKISHICSMYIMSSLGNDEFPPGYFNSYEIPINYEFIDNQIEYVLDLDKLLNNFDTNFDATVDYNDIIPILKYSQSEIFPKPTNHNELRLAITERYNVYLNQ